METKNHLFKISILYPTAFENWDDLILQYDNLGGKIYNFIKYVEENWKT